MRQPRESALVVVNNAAAGARRAWPYVKGVLEENDVRFEAVQPAAPGDVEMRVRSALREGFGTIAIVGGDGTLSEAARGFFESPAHLKDEETPPRRIETEAALAILPAGTGNDFARGLKGARASLDECLRKLVRHCRALRVEGSSPSQRDEALNGQTTRLVDTLYASTDAGARRFVCLNAATLGIGADVATRVSAQSGRMRRLPGEARFALAAAGALIAWRNREVRVSVDDDYLLECATNLIAVTNGAYAGGGMHFAPAARPDDGSLEVVTACKISRAGIVRELARVHRGGHLANPKVIVKSGARVHVETVDAKEKLTVEADGDVRGQTPADFRLMPASLRVVW